MNFNIDNYNKLLGTISEIDKETDNLPDETKGAVHTNISVTKTKLEKILKASQIPASLGVFGESQVGKSFLISKLVGDKTTVNIQGYEDKTFRDFNSDYGGGETTAVVTRLTSKNDPDIIPGKVLLKIISVENLISTYLNGYYLEHKGQTEEQDIEKLEKLTESIKQKFENSTSTDVDDLNYEVRNTLIKECQKLDNLLGKGKEPAINKMLKILSDTSYKNKNLNHSDLIDLISLLWMHEDILTDFFKSHFELLKSINFVEKLLIDAKHLKGVICMNDQVQLTQNLQSIPIEGGFIVRDSINSEELKRLQYIVKEVVLPLSIKSEELLLSKIDILDFPGAKNLGNENKDKAINFESFNEIFKRGKIKHFFDDYVESYDIAYLLLCIAAEGDQHVRTLPAMIRDWYEKRIKNVEDKLDIVFTKADMMIHRESTIDAYTNTINNKFTSFYRDFSSVPFKAKWANTENPFEDFSLMMNHGASQIYDPNTGEIEKGHEDTRKLLKEAFLLNDAVKNIWSNNEKRKEVFEAAFESNDGGVKYLLEKLNKKIKDKDFASKEKMKHLNSQIIILATEVESMLQQNGIPKDSGDDVNQIKHEIKLLTDALSKDWNILPRFIANIMSDFPSYNTLTPLLNPKKSNSPYAVSRQEKIDMEELVEKIIESWFNNIKDDKNASIFKKSQLLGYTKYKQNMKPALIEYLKKFKTDLERLNTLLSNQENSVVDDKEKTITHFLTWICGDYLMFLEDTNKIGMNNINKFNFETIPFEEILEKWNEKLISVYTEGRIHSGTQQTNLNFGPYYQSLTDIVNDN